MPLLDLCAVVGERVRTGQGPMHADRRHLHHLLFDAGLTHPRVVLVMALWSGAFIGLHALLVRLGVSDLVLLAVFLAIAVLYWMTRRAYVQRLSRLFVSRPILGPAE